MKTFRQWLFDGLAALSMLLFVTVGMVLVPSIQGRAGVSYACTPERTGQTWIGVNVYRENAFVEVDHFANGAFGSVPGAVGFHSSSDFLRVDVLSHFITHIVPLPRVLFERSIPIWSVILLTAALPTARVLVWVKGAPVRTGFCAECGYDLRATPERCPECGTIPIKRVKLSN